MIASSLLGNRKAGCEPGSEAKAPNYCSFLLENQFMVKTLARC